MASNLTGARIWTPHSESNRYGGIPMAGGQKWFPGSLVGWDTNSSNSATTQGYGVKYDQTAANNGIVLIGRYTGNIIPSQNTFGGTAVGSFGATADNSGTSAPTGNGAIVAEVEFYKLLTFLWFDNVAGGHACVQANVGSAVYAESDHEVGNTAGSLSKVGILWALGTSADNTVGQVLVAIGTVN
jgi:hypothetical protein